VIKKIPLRFKMLGPALLGPALLGPALLGPALLGPALTLVATPVQARVVDRVVAVVNEGIITWSELEDVARPILAQVGEVSDPVLREQTRDRQLRRVLDDLVGQKLIMQEAERRGIAVQPEEVDQHIDRIKSRQSWDEDTFATYLQGQGLSLTEFRKQVKDQLLRQNIIRRVLGTRIQVTDRELQDYYKEQSTQQKADFEVESAHIVLKVPKNATAAEDADGQYSESEVRPHTSSRGLLMPEQIAERARSVRPSRSSATATKDARTKAARCPAGATAAEGWGRTFEALY
jgi:parvulin-like peptidyl-prolyl isomerase